MSELVLHRGAQEVDLSVLDLVPVPESTDTYQPVSHYQLANTLEAISQDLLKGHELQKTQYALARDGRQMFGCLTFTGNGDTGLSVGFRNSYDKSMAVGIAIGAKVFVCDNLAFKGDITILRKHTSKVWEAIENLAISTLYKAGKAYEDILVDFEGMMGFALSQDEGYRMLGFLYGHGVLSPRQLTNAFQEWNTPTHEAFKERNLYSLYNSATEALKSCPPLSIMEKHSELHRLITH